MSVCKNLYLRRIEGKFHYDPIKQQITDIYELPCGKCTNCKIQIAKEWALRCCLELPYWDKSIFTTLTFRDSEMSDPSIHKKELSDFFHNVRNDLRKTNQKIKILGCGEYGDESMRKHYHAIIFGLGMSNEKVTISHNCETYTSENSILERNWGKGNVFNGVVTYNSCRYVASYVFKKYYDELKEEFYTSKGLENPFQHTSNGIGKQFYDEWNNNILTKGYIMFNGIKYTIPRYFLDLYKKEELNKRYKLREMQQKHAEEDFWQWYKKKTKEIAKITFSDPNEFNCQLLSQVDPEFIQAYDEERKEQNEAKANLAEARNNLF